MNTLRTLFLCLSLALTGCLLNFDGTNNTNTDPEWDEASTSVPDAGDEWIEGQAEQPDDEPEPETVEPTPIKPLDDMTMDEVDEWLESLTAEQQMELIVYADELSAWDSTGRNGPEPEPPEWLKPYLKDPEARAKIMGKSKRSGSVEPENTEPEPVAAQMPDPLAAEPPPKMKAAGSSQSRVWLFCYGGDWCPGCRWDKPKIQAWANKRGIVSSDYEVGNSLMANVVFVDVTKTVPQRNLTYDRNRGPLYPTYVLVDEDGRELWHRVGTIDLDYVDLLWDLANM